MLDIQFIRENAQVVKEAAKNKNVKVDIDALLEMDRKRKDFLQKLEDLRAKKNDVNDRIKLASDKDRLRIIEEGKNIKEELEKVEPRYKRADERYAELMMLVPNIPSDDTPIGKDEDENVVVKQWGEKPQFPFKPKEHFEIAEALDLIDSERAAKVSGARFNYLKGDLVLMEFALIQLAFLILTDEKKLKEIAEENSLNVSTKSFTPVLPPVMIRPEMHKRMARLDPEEMYLLERDNLSLVGSAEHTLGAMYANETLKEEEMPIRMVGFSTAFRREAGTYGKDMKGMLRVHQFNKMEIESFTLKEYSLDEQNFIVAIQEYLMRELEIPYQVVAVCTGDMGKPDVRQIDIEAWMPGQGKYRETHTSDLIGDFQARRLNTKVKRADGETQLVHMNDATVFSERPLIAILENNQQEDGSVMVPKILRKWMGKDRIQLKG